MADTLTTNLSLTKPQVDVSDPNTDWAAKLNANLDLIDATFTLTTPSTQNFGDSANPGTSLFVARADHVHGIPAALLIFKNILVNGGFDICQRTSPFSSPANNAHTLDKWQIKQGGGTPATFTVTADTTGADLDTSSTQCLKLQCTNIGASLTDGLYISQKIENYQEYRGMTVSFSVRVKTALGSSKVHARIKDSAGNTVSNVHSGSGNYETLTVSRQIDAAATFILFEVGMLGTADVTVATLLIDNAMCVLGGVSASYTPLPIGEELDRCLRYYQALSLYCVGTGGSDGTNYILGESQTIHPMPSTATVKSTTGVYVYEDGSVVDHKASYTATSTLTNYNGSGPQDWTVLNFQVSKTIATNRPVQYGYNVILEDA